MQENETNQQEIDQARELLKEACANLSYETAHGMAENWRGNTTELDNIDRDQLQRERETIEAAVAALGGEDPVSQATIRADILAGLEAISSAQRVDALALVPLTEAGIPARLLLLDAYHIDHHTKDWPDLIPVDGKEAVHDILHGLSLLLETPVYAVGERVKVARPLAQAGLQGEVKKVKRTGLKVSYLVRLDGKSATALNEYSGYELESLQAPAPNEQGGYYTPVFLTPGGNYIAFPSPDMVAPDIEGAHVCLGAFQNSVVGLSMMLEGLRATDRIEFVTTKGQHVVSLLDLAGFKTKVLIIGGPDYDQARAAVEGKEVGEWVAAEPQADVLNRAAAIAYNMHEGPYDAPTLTSTAPDQEGPPAQIAGDFMRLDTPPGSKVKYNRRKNGTARDLVVAAKHLVEGATYTVKQIATGAQEAAVELEEAPGVAFNCVLFTNHLAAPDDDRR